MVVLNIPAGIAGTTARPRPSPEQTVGIPALSSPTPALLEPGYLPDTTNHLRLSRIGVRRPPCKFARPARRIASLCTKRHILHLVFCRLACMAEDARQRRPPPRRTSQDVVPEPEPAHTRRSEAESDDEREATELQSVTSTQHSGRRRSRVLSPSSASSKLHWYDPLSKYWRHNVNITVPHDDCRDHLGKAGILFEMSVCMLRVTVLSYQPPLAITTTDISAFHQQTSAHSSVTYARLLRSPYSVSLSLSCTVCNMFPLRIPYLGIMRSASLSPLSFMFQQHA